MNTYTSVGPNAVEPDVQRAGSYFLPKHVLRIVVKETTAGKRTITAIPDAVPDRRSLAQVGYHLSAFSNDDIKVEYEANGLLKGVAAIATDKTGDIIVQVARTIGAFRATVAEQEAAVAIYEFDPFNWDEANYVNSQLKKNHNNSCVEVEVAPGIWSPGCRSAGRGQVITKAYSNDDFRTFPPEAPGIYYRRPIEHKVRIVENGKTKQYLSMAFANNAPIFRIDIDRTAFVERKTTVTFSNGVPTLIQVVKPSEGLAIVSLPLTVVNAVISAPVDAITERKKVMTAQAGLLEEQARLVQVEQKVRGLGVAPAVGLDFRQATLPADGFNRNAQARPVSDEQCADIQVDPALCRAISVR